MKKIFLVLGFVIAFIFCGLNVGAKTNLLHSITLDKSLDAYNIVLDTDSVSKVVKKVQSDNVLVLELSGITSSDTVNAFYKGASTIDSLVIENSGLNKLKIYISAPDISSANVVLQPASGEITIAKEPLPANKFVWTLFVLAVLGMVINRSIKRTNEDNSIMIKHDIKEREIELYRQYKSSLDAPVSLNSKDVKMKNLLKKIDRKIDERLSVLSR